MDVSDHIMIIRSSTMMILTTLKDRKTMISMLYYIIMNDFNSIIVTVDELVKKWSPLVWLAPNEKFLPGNVKTFLSNVHAEREKLSSQKIKDIGDNLSKYSHYYEDLVYYEGTDAKSNSAVQNNRKRRNFDKDTSLEYIFELPIDDASENWFLVTNEEIGKFKLY